MKLYDPDTGAEVWSDIIAHYGVVYDLRYATGTPRAFDLRKTSL